MLGLHPDLRRHAALVFVSSAVVGVLGALMIVAAAVDLPAVRPVPAWVLFTFGAGFLALGFVGTVLSPRWYREATRIVASSRPVQATVTLRLDQDSDSTSLTARVPPGAATRAAKGEIPLLVPRWDVKPILDTPVEVSLYIHPHRDRVVAISTDRGLLWSIPYNRPGA